MANELDVAGEFIYAAIDKFNRMNNFDQVGDNFFSYDFKDRDSLIEYVQKHCKEISFDYSLCKKTPLNTDKVKEFFGRTIGRLCQKYYKEIEEASRNMYCYELRYNSAAEKIFCGNEEKGSYQKKIDREKRAIKELLLYLRDPREMNKFIEYMDRIESLPFDIAVYYKNDMNYAVEAD